MTIELIHFSQPTVSFEQAMKELASGKVKLHQCLLNRTYRLALDDDPDTIIAQVTTRRENNTGVGELTVDPNVLRRLNLQTVAIEEGKRLRILNNKNIIIGPKRRQLFFTLDYKQDGTPKHVRNLIAYVPERIAFKKI